MRRVLIVLGVLLAVLAAGTAVVVQVLLRPEMLKAAVESQASAALGREVTVGGARARLFPSPAITLSGVHVAGAQPLSAEDVRIGASLRGLLRRRIEDGDVRVVGGRVTLGSAPPTGDASRAAPPPSSRGQTGIAAEPAGRMAITGAGGAGPARFTIASIGSIRFEHVVIAGGGREVQLDMEGRLEGDRLDVQHLGVSSGTTSLRGSGTLTSLQRLDGRFAFTSPLVDADEMLAVIAALVPSDPAAVGTTSTWMGEEAAAPDGFVFGHITARARIDKGQALGYEIRNVQASIDLQGTRLDVRPLTFELFGGQYDSSLQADLAANHVAFSHEGRLAGANVATLSEAFGKAGAATGVLGLLMRVRGSGPSFTKAAAQAAGSAEVAISNGTIAGLNVVRQAFTLLGISGSRASEQGERFERVTAHVALAGSSMSTEDFAMHAADFDLTGSARVDGDGRLQGHVDVTLSEALSKEAQSRNKDLKLAFEDGRITLPAALGGTLAEPSVMPDLGEALQRAARNKLRLELDKARDRASDRVKKQLDRLFKH